MAQARLTKRCTRCGEDQPLSEFYRGKRYKDGYHPWCRTCKNENNREWQRSPQGKDWRRKDYRRKRKTILAAKARQHQELLADPERLARKRATQQRAHDKFRRTQPERYKLLRAVKNLRQRAKRYPGRGGVLTLRGVEARVAYFGGKCWVCNAPWEHIDHVIPISRGGPDWPANIRPACGQCNIRRQA